MQPTIAFQHDDMKRKPDTLFDLVLTLCPQITSARTGVGRMFVCRYLVTQNDQCDAIIILHKSEKGTF